MKLWNIALDLINGKKMSISNKELEGACEEMWSRLAEMSREEKDTHLRNVAVRMGLPPNATKEELYSFLDNHYGRVR